MRLWKSLRHWLPRTTRWEAKDLVSRTAREALHPEILQLEEKREALQAEVRELQTSVHQLVSILGHEDPSVLPPPKHLQVRVVGSYVPRFIESGFSICDELNVVLRVVGRQLGDFPRILDFGCGCGRLGRALKDRAPTSTIFGADIDAEAIAWAQAHYGRFAEYRTTPPRPPTSFEDSFFDFVLSLSVFTHLPEDMQFAWLEELRRITKPGGYLILTTSGENNYPANLQEYIRTRGFHYSDAEKYGQGISLPDFYQNTFHAHHYIHREWSKYFEVVDVRYRQLEGHQDTVLLRKRATPPRSSS